MFGAPETSTNARPAVIDGQVVLLPTLAGLMNGDTGLESAPSRDLWTTLAAAVMAEQVFDEIEESMAEGRTLADVIDINARRRRT